MSRFVPAHAAVAGAFFLTGLVFGTWAARVPALQAGIGLTDGELALALIALNGGAVVGLQAGAVLCRRFGSRATLRVALPVFAVFLLPIALAPTLPALATAFAASAAANSVVDVAINVNGGTVERRYRRVVLSRLHAMLTLGGLVGAAIGAGAAHFGAGSAVHFAAIAAVGAGGAVWLGRWLATDEPDAARSGSSRPGPRRRGGAGWLLGLGGLAFCVTLAEGSGNDWTAVYLHDLGASDAMAASGVAVFFGAMTAGRLAGDHLRVRVDAVPLVRGAALVAAVGLGLALLLRHPLAGLVGFGLLGLGLSVTLPVIIGVASHRAAETGQSTAATVARVSTMAYLGSFAGPGLIGAMATATSLSTALFVSVAAAGVAVLGAGLLARQASPPVTAAFRRMARDSVKLAPGSPADTIGLIAGMSPSTAELSHQVGRPLDAAAATGSRRTSQPAGLRAAPRSHVNRMIAREPDRIG